MLPRTIPAIGILIVATASCGESPQRPGEPRDTAVETGAPDLGAWETGAPDLPVHDSANLHPDAPTVDPNQDTDGDGLPDSFETLYGLDSTKKDSDSDGTPDGSEDDDGDGLTAAEEWAAWQLSPVESQKASPRHKDLLIELDYQKGCGPSAAVLAKAVEAFAAADQANPDGSTGIALHVYTDEKDLAVQNMSDDLAARLSYLGAHGPKFSGKHVAKMVHVVFVAERPGLGERGAETVGSSGESAEKAGVLVYAGNLAKVFPACLVPNGVKVSVEQATGASLVHELGHVLQLGHDTEVGGGINPYNIMATDPPTCAEVRKRILGDGNTDPSLGATQTTGGPRFSKAAAALMKLKNKISVEANKFEIGEGYEM